MSGMFRERAFQPCSKAELASKVNGVIDECRDMHGHDNEQWSGLSDQSLNVSDRIFDDDEGASNWLCDNAQSRGPIVVVKVLDTLVVNTESFSKKIKTLRDSIETLNGRVFEIQDNALKRSKSNKGKLKTCPDCTSKVALSYCGTRNCPVCFSSDFLITKADKAAIASADKKIKLKMKAIEQLKEDRTNFIAASQKMAKNKDKWHWRAAAWCKQ